MFLGWYRHWINNCLPRSLKPPDCTIDESQLPYIYPAVKRKCFNGWQGGMNTCVKPGHPCFRNVCSLRPLPCRHTFRHVCRAFRHLLLKHSCGWMIGDVAGAHRTLADDPQNTLRRPPLCEGKGHTCLCCGGEMSTPGFACKDAGQAYEAVPTEHVHSSLEVLFRRSLGPSSFGRKDTPISVFKGTRFATSKGGRVDCGYGARTVLWVSRVRRCAFTILGMRHFRPGADSVVSQETGIPTGGPISGACLNASFASEENC